jgi:hypothetical protein
MDKGSKYEVYKGIRRHSSNPNLATLGSVQEDASHYAIRLILDSLPKTIVVYCYTPTFCPTFGSHLANTS